VQPENDLRDVVFAEVSGAESRGTVARVALASASASSPTGLH
jgi:hypothetical protein